MWLLYRYDIGSIGITWYSLAHDPYTMEFALMLSTYTTLKQKSSPRTPHCKVVENLWFWSWDQHLLQLQFQRFQIPWCSFAIANLLKLLSSNPLDGWFHRARGVHNSLIYLNRFDMESLGSHLILLKYLLRHCNPPLWAPPPIAQGDIGVNSTITYNCIVLDELILDSPSKTHDQSKKTLLQWIKHKCTRVMFLVNPPF